MAHTFQVWVPLVVATSHELGLAFLVMLEHLFLDFGSFKDGFDLEWAGHLLEQVESWDADVGAARTSRQTNKRAHVPEILKVVRKVKFYLVLHLFRLFEDLVEFKSFTWETLGT